MRKIKTIKKITLLASAGMLALPSGLFAPNSKDDFNSIAVFEVQESSLEQKQLNLQALESVDPNLATCYSSFAFDENVKGVLEKLSKVKFLNYNEKKLVARIFLLEFTQDKKYTSNEWILKKDLRNFIEELNGLKFDEDNGKKEFAEILVNLLENKVESLEPQTGSEFKGSASSEPTIAYCENSSSAEVKAAAAAEANPVAETVQIETQTEAEVQASAAVQADPPATLVQRADAANQSQNRRPGRVKRFLRSLCCCFCRGR